MTRRMLINAQSQEELRVAIVNDGVLEEFQIEVADSRLTRGNIYRGVISNIQPSLNAAFIDYGAERNGFLAIQDVVEDAYYKKPKGSGRPRIEDVLEKGKPIVVQVQKEAEGQKGAVLTTNLSLAGRYLVLTPFDSTRGISRKVDDDAVRKKLRSQAGKLDVPDGVGFIIRTNAHDQTKTALSRDLSALLRLWKQIEAEARRGRGTKLLYNDQDLILQAFRDYLDSSIAEVQIDSDEAFESAQAYKKAFMPRSKTRLERYTDRMPLFARHNLEAQLDRIYDRVVTLPSGGSIVIDRTEALTAIDVNSGRSTKGASQEETAVSTNLEAAAEVGRQLRLRDIGGLMVVDFIDMRAARNRKKIEKVMRDALKDDRARSTIGRISSNGLLEINRQRIQQALHMRTHRPCPTCRGTGRIASREMVGLALLRRIEARAADGLLKAVRIALHPELADSFQNTRRRDIAALEEEFAIKVEVIASSRLHRPEQEIEWYERDPGEAPAVVPQERKASVRAVELVALEEEAGAEADEDEDDDSGSGRSRGRGRRRRRGGGRRGGGRSGSDDSGSSDGSDSDSSDDSSSGRSRRGRGRSRKKDSDSSDDSGSGRSRRGRGRSRKDDSDSSDDAGSGRSRRGRGRSGKDDSDGSDSDSSGGGSGRSRSRRSRSTGRSGKGSSDDGGKDGGKGKGEDDDSGSSRRSSRGRRGGRSRSRRSRGDGDSGDSGRDSDKDSGSSSDGGSRRRGSRSSDDDSKDDRSSGRGRSRGGRGRSRSRKRSDESVSSDDG